MVYGSRCVGRAGLPRGGVVEGGRQFVTGEPFCWLERDEAADAA
jgi:hypothetical protein